MAQQDDRGLDELLAIRKPDAHLEGEVVADDFALQLRVDLRSYPKFPRVDDAVTYPRTGSDVRQQIDVDSGAELPDYSGPYKADLRFTDCSKDALASRFLPWSEAYLQLCVDGWAREVAKRYGAETMAQLSTCPRSMIVTTQLYNPNMKVEILAIPPRKDPGEPSSEPDRD